MGLIPGVDDGPLERGLQADLALEEVRALGQLETVRATVHSDADPAGATHHLTHHEEGRQVLDDVKERGPPGHEVVLMGPIGLPLAVGVVLVEIDSRRHRAQPLDRLAHDQFTGSVPPDGVARIGDLGRAVLGMGVIDVEPGAVGEDDIGHRRVIERRITPLIGELARMRDSAVHLEAACVPQRRLVGVIPRGARRTDSARRGIRRHHVSGEHHGVGLRSSGDRDSVFGLDPHDPAHRHGSRLRERASPLAAVPLG